VITKESLFLIFSVVILPLIKSFPFPVLYKFNMSPKTKPAVGKSGPITILHNSSIVIFSFFM
jgi:hypothetical protein